MTRRPPGGPGRHLVPDAARRKPAHVGVWYTPALRQRGGIGRYTRELMDALWRAETSDSVAGASVPLGSGLGDLVLRDPVPGTSLPRVTPPRRYTLVVSRDAATGARRFPAHVTLKRLPFTDRWLMALWDRVRMPLWVDAWAGPFDLFHSPDFTLPPLWRAPGIVTVHDLSFRAYPEGALPALRRWLERAVPRAVARARHVLADSESTRRDVEAWLGVPASKVTVVGAGVDARFRPVTDARRLSGVRERYGLPPRFVLGLGTLEPRKNFDGLIRAFERIATDVPDLDLVIAGGDGWLFDATRAAARTSPAAARIHFAGFVADDDLPAVYSLARAFAFPSHYEGFGIPVLEAMACGVPVVCADNSSVPEVAGDAALYVGATDVGGLAAALGRLHRDEVLRARLAADGRTRAARFTWDAAAGKLATVYDRLLSGSTGG